MSAHTPTAWIPASLVQFGELVNFPPGTLIVDPSEFEDGAVSLGLRVSLGEEPGLLQLTPSPEKPTATIFGIDEDDVGFGVASPLPLELEWDLQSATASPGLTLEAVGRLGLGKTGVRLVVGGRRARGASYLDPSDWTLRTFKNGHDARILVTGWRLVLPLGPDRRIVVFDATPDDN